MRQRRAPCAKPNVVAGAILQLVACGHNSDAANGDCARAAPVSGGAALAADSGIATPVSATLLAECSGELPVMFGFDAQRGEAREPDWGCYADAVKDACPSLGVEKSATVQVSYAPGNNVAVAGVVVDQFFGPSTRGKPSFSGVTDDAGRVTFQAPSGTERISFWLHGATGTGDALKDLVDVYAFGVPLVWPPSVVSASAVVSVAVNTVLINVLGSLDLADRNRAVIMAAVRDCSGHDVAGAQLELVDATTNTVITPGVGVGEPRAVYGRYALPDTTCRYTNAERAEWMMLNAPTNVSGGAASHAYKVRATGRMRASDTEPVLLDERAIELYPGSFSFVYPYRVWPPAIP